MTKRSYNPNSISFNENLMEMPHHPGLKEECPKFVEFKPMSYLGNDLYDPALYSIWKTHKETSSYPQPYERNEGFRSKGCIARLLTVP